MKQKKRSNNILLVIAMAAMVPFFMISAIIGAVVVIAVKTNVEDRILTWRAINYFSKEYGVNKREIKIIENNLSYSGCFLSYCDGLTISYEGKEYLIDYNKESNHFTIEYLSDDIDDE